MEQQKNSFDLKGPSHGLVMLRQKLARIRSDRDDLISYMSANELPSRQIDMVKWGYDQYIRTLDKNIAGIRKKHGITTSI